MTLDPKDMLKEKKVRATRQRIEVLNQLINSDVCLSAEEIHNNLIAKRIDINLATVYRIMNEFAKKGIVDKNIINKKCFFELKSVEKHHHYFVCIKCNKKTNIVDCKINLIEEELNQKNFKVISHNLEIYGICNHCGRNKNEKN